MWHLTALFLVALSSYAFAVNPYTLTDLDGRSFEAIILSKSDESVTVLNLDGQDFKIPLSQLTKVNTAYIQSWSGSTKSVNEGRYDLADAYYDGNGVKQDLKKAFSIFEKGALARDANCQLMVGYSYRDGEGVKSNSVKAAQWFEKSARQGNSMAEAMLGRAYLNGTGVGKNFTYAKMYISRSAAQNNSYGLYLYGYMNYYGYGIKKNQQEGVRLLQLSEGKGNKSAKELLTKIGSQRAIAAARARSTAAYVSKIDRDEDDVIFMENGAVVRISWGYLGWIGWRKDAILFKDGRQWKIWIEGKKAFKCEVIVTPNVRGQSAQLVHISEMLGNGTIIKMLDGSLFEVGSFYSIDTSIWLGISDGLLIDDSRLINFDEGAIVEVTRLK